VPPSGDFEFRVTPSNSNTFLRKEMYAQYTDIFEMRVQILTTSYWLHVELGKIFKNSMSKNKMTFIF
jgi:hypothetical protein